MAAQEVGGIRDRIQPELIPDEDCWGNLQTQLHMIDINFDVNNVYSIRYTKRITFI